MAADIGPKDTSPKRPFNFTLRRRQCAHFGHSVALARFLKADITAGRAFDRYGEGFRTPAPTRHRVPPRGRRPKASQGGNRGQDGLCLAGRDLWGIEGHGRLAFIAAGASGLGLGGLDEDDGRV